MALYGAADAAAWRKRKRKMKETMISIGELCKVEIFCWVTWNLREEEEGEDLGSWSLGKSTE